MQTYKYTVTRVTTEQRTARRDADNRAALLAALHRNDDKEQHWVITKEVTKIEVERSR